MRRFGGILLVAASIALAVPASAAATPLSPEAAPDAWTGTYQVAEAAWIVRDGRRLRMHLVFVENVSGPRPKAHTAVFIGDGPCRVPSGRSPKRASCSVDGRFRRIAPEAFSIDPSLSSAGLTLPGIKIDWTSTAFPEPDDNEYVDPPFVDVEAEVKRPSSAAGRMNGRRFVAKRLTFARLAQGAFVGADPDTLGPSSVRIVVRLDA